MPSSLAEGHPECLEVFSRSTPLHLSPCDNCSRVAELQIEDNTEDAEDSRFICPHRRAQPQTEMMIEPTELRWSTTGGMQKVLLINPSKERRAIKVKCSDNNLYRVNPVFSFVEPGHSLSVDIVRQNGGAKIDKMVFVIAKAEPDDTQPRTLFQPGVAHPMMVLPLIAK